ncbi:hypothetical protein TWF106_011511 [Orbilia oligospora]|uniref:Uncharacterized protein n=1 Tax=Orbilia oligospora TaxID=2813651 RepID=A0A7C8UB33_ORBOL|nr:hypothetical protein TWF106_011511 [Orbilia oligospora]
MLMLAESISQSWLLVRVRSKNADPNNHSDAHLPEHADVNSADDALSGIGLESRIQTFVAHNMSAADDHDKGYHRQTAYHIQCNKKEGRNLNIVAQI